MNTGYYGYILYFETLKCIREFEVVLRMDAEAERQIDNFIIDEQNERLPGGGWRIRKGYKDFDRLLYWLQRDGHIQNKKVIKDKRRRKNETYTA